MSAAVVIVAAIVLAIAIQVARAAMVYFRPGDVRSDIGADAYRSLNDPRRLLR